MRRPTITIAIVMLGACSAPAEIEDGGSDAEGDAGMDAGDGGPCEGEYLLHEWELDGARGSTGCVAARSATATGSNGTATEFAYNTELIVEDGLPPGICGTYIGFYNTPLVTGATSVLEESPDSPPADPSLPQVVLTTLVAWDGSTLAERCNPGGGGTLPRVTGGHWYVVDGGELPGDWVDIEARDVTFERFGEHTFRFERMRWHVQLREPVVLP